MLVYENARLGKAADHLLGAVDLMRPAVGLLGSEDGDLRAQLRVALSEMVEVAEDFHHAAGPTEVERTQIRRWSTTECGRILGTSLNEEVRG